MKKSKTKRLSINERLTAAGAEPKKVWLIIGALDAFIVGLAVFLYFQKLSIYLCLAFVAVIPIGDYMLLGMFFKNKNKAEINLETEFVRLFGYLSVYLQDGIPVYSSLERIRAYASPAMDERLKELLERIDGDKTVSPYVRFAEGFPSLMVKEVLVSLYLIAEQGGTGAYITQFQKSFDTLSDEKRKIDRERRVSSLNTLCFLPMIGSGVTMVMILAGIVVLMRELTNGI